MLKFEIRQFSKRFPPIECAVIVYHEPPQFAPAGTPSGRATGARIILRNGQWGIGVAVCAPGDQFNRKTGRNKAIGRAYKHLVSRGDLLIGIDPNLPMNVHIDALKDAVADHKADIGWAL